MNAFLRAFLLVISVELLAVTAATCEEQLNNQACSGQFGNRECYTCGDRINWLQSADGGGKNPEAARLAVGREFISECGACAGPMPELSTGDYSEVWRDDFEGNGAVDTSKWEHIHSHGNGFGNNELQYYTNRQDNSWVSDGTLKIRARKENFDGKGYTSAKLQTRADWLYGKFSVRARLNRGVGKGTWAANWMMPRVHHYGIWPHSGEIDIMEHVGFDTGTVHGTVHTGCCHHSIGTQVGGTIGADVNAWHTYTVEWREDLILFAMDGKVYQTYGKTSQESHQWPFNQNFYIILNMAVGGDWGGAQGIDEGVFHGEGQIMEIDWVVVEQRSGIGGGSDGGGGNTCNNLACDANQDCHSCADRIVWLQSQDGGSKSPSEAMDETIRAFPSECGNCDTADPFLSSSVRTTSLRSILIAIAIVYCVK